MSALFANYKTRKYSFWLIVVLMALVLLFGLPKGANAADVTFVNGADYGFYPLNASQTTPALGSETLTGTFNFIIKLDPKFSNSSLEVVLFNTITLSELPLLPDGKTYQIRADALDPVQPYQVYVKNASSLTANSYNIVFKNAALPTASYFVSSITNTTSHIPVAVNSDNVFTTSYGKTISFELGQKTGYIQGAVKVYYNSSSSTYSTPVTPNYAGVYTIPNITENIEIYVEGYDPLSCIMTLPASVAGKFTVSVINGYNPNAVPYGGTFAFSIELADAYSYIIPSGVSVSYTNSPSVTPTVTQSWAKNGKVITYTFTGINGHLTFGIDHSGWSLTPHKITLPQSEAGKYLVTTLVGYDANNVANGSDFRFSVRLTSAYANMTPAVYANGQQIHGDNYSGEYIFTLVNVTENKVVTMSLTDTGGNSNAVYRTITFAGVDSTKIAVSPASGSAVLNGSSFAFTITPTAQYASNTVAPVVSAAGVVINAVKVGNSWQYTLPSVVADTTVVISIPTSWVQDTNVTPVTYSVAFSGTGFTVGNVVGGTSSGSLVYSVPTGGSFSFSLNAQAGYDASTIVVNVNNMVLTPHNGVYSINNINENKAVTVSFGGTANDSAFKELTLTDGASGISLTAMFSGNPRLVITPIGPGDKSYDGLKQYIGNRDVLGAYDVSIVDGKYYGPITINFAVGVGYNTYPVYVLHGKVNGIDSYSPVVSNGKATVTVRSLSPFIISDVAFSNSTGTLGGAGATTGGTTILPPRTGDVIGKIGFALVGICSLALAVLCLRNRAKAKAEYIEGE